MKIKKGDKVIVITGKDKGKEGQVVKALPQRERVVIEGVNLMKKRARATKEGQKGQVLTKAAPIHVSNVKKIA